MDPESGSRVATCHRTPCDGLHSSNCFRSAVFGVLCSYFYLRTAVLVFFESYSYLKPAVPVTLYSYSKLEVLHSNSYTLTRLLPLRIPLHLNCSPRLPLLVLPPSNCCLRLPLFVLLFRTGVLVLLYSYSNIRPSVHVFRCSCYFV